MARLFVIVPFVALALDVFAIVDIALIEERRVRALNKALWIVIVLLLPIIGAVLWFLLGRERRSDRGGERRVVAPDDDPAFLSKLRQQEDADERIRRLEQELSELDDDQPPTR
jgi:hypothetical protein